MSETERIVQRYQRRTIHADPTLYSFTRSDVMRGAHEVDTVTMTALLDAGLRDLPRVRLLEIGCGAGGNLLRFLRWGLQPEHLVGNDLLEHRLTTARHLLPTDVRLVSGDARTLTLGTFDVVYQSTVLSSIGEDDFQQQLADRMWEMTRPGGIILSYDFVYNNPKNVDVRKVTTDRVRHLFPHGQFKCWRVTLAPPIARRAARFSPIYSALAAIPALRTHAVCTIRKRTT